MTDTAPPDPVPERLKEIEHDWPKLLQQGFHSDLGDTIRELITLCRSLLLPIHGPNEVPEDGQDLFYLHSDSLGGKSIYKQLSWDGFRERRTNDSLGWVYESELITRFQLSNL